MRPLVLMLLSWCVVAVLGAFVAGWWYATGAVHVASVAYVSAVERAETASVRDMGAVRAHIFARETAQARQRLGALAGQDVVSISKFVETAAEPAGVSLRIAGANVSGPVQGAKSLRSIAFSLEGEGRFGQVFRAAELLGALPAPSALERFEFTKAASDATAKEQSPWQISAQVRIVSNNLPQN